MHLDDAFQSSLQVTVFNFSAMDRITNSHAHQKTDSSKLLAFQSYLVLKPWASNLDVQESNLALSKFFSVEFYDDNKNSNAE